MHTTSDLDECQARAMKIMGEAKKQLERLGLEVSDRSQPERRKVAGADA